MHVLNDSFSSPFKRFKPYQDHIFLFVLFIVGFSRYRPRNGRKASLFNRIFNWSISKFCVFMPSDVQFLKTKVFLDNINRLSYSCDLLIAFLQILWAIIGWKTFLVSFLIGHWNFTGQLTSDAIVAKIIGRTIAWLRKQSWPLPPEHWVGMQLRTEAAKNEDWRFSNFYVLRCTVHLC